MNAVAVVSIYVVTNRAPYLKCDAPVSIYVAVVWIPDHPTAPGLLEGLCQTMLLVTKCFRKLKLSQEPARSVLPPPAFVSGSALTLDHPTGRSGTECEAPSGILALIDAH